MSYLNLAKTATQATPVPALDSVMEEIERCARCLELEAEGEVTLVCGTCGYLHPRTRVAIALDGRRLRTRAIAEIAGLPLKETYEALGHMLDHGSVLTDPSGEFWLKENYGPSA